VSNLTLSVSGSLIWLLAYDLYGFWVKTDCCTEL